MRRAPASAAALLALALAAFARPAAAQESADRLARGIRAYRELDFDSAAIHLRAVLATPGARALADADRARALVYLGASEVFREQRDSALAVFRRLVTLDPRYRPDQLIFPPEVVGLFDQARVGTAAVALAVPAVTEIAGGRRLATRLYASSFHEITVTLARRGTGGAGEPLRTLYAGGIFDSLDVLWDGRDSAGVPVGGGSYLLRVASRGPRGGPARTVEVPLEVQRQDRDTLPLPPAPAASLLRPETTSRGSSPRVLLVGAAAAAAAIVLPSLVASGSDPSSARFGVAVAIGAASIGGFAVQRRPVPIPENLAANQALRLAWERDRAAAVAENERRRREASLVVRAGAPVIGEAR